MSNRLPTPGGDSGDWGDILNDFLDVAHNDDGSLLPAALQQAGAVTSVNGKTTAGDGIITLAPSDIGAYQKPSNGIPSGDMVTAVQTALTQAGTAVQLGGDLGGTNTAPTVAKLQGTTLDPSSPTDGQVLAYSNASTAWVPATVTSSTVSDATTSSKGIVELAGDLSGVASAPTVVSTHLAAPLPLNQGGTGATSQNFVDLSATQTIAGTKTFSSTITGSISRNAATVTTNANLTGPITSTGNATAVAAQTGTGSTFVMSASPALTGTPTAPTATNGTNTTQLATTAFVQSAVTGGGAPDATSSVAGLVELTGDFSGTYNSPQVVSTHLASALPVNQGGTGSTSQNFVDLSTTQTVGGAKTFSSGISTTTLQVTTSPTAGYVLTADSSGHATWQAASGGGGGVSASSANTWTAAQTFNAGELLDKGEIVFDVKAYGAKGDGAQDDTTYIQSAITAALASKDGTAMVYFPAGTYKITASLNCTSATGSASGMGSSCAVRNITPARYSRIPDSDRQ